MSTRTTNSTRRRRRSKRNTSRPTSGTSRSNAIGNVRDTFWTKDSWMDLSMGVVGGLMYVWVPTLIQRVNVSVNKSGNPAIEDTYTVKGWDINGWSMLLLGVGIPTALGAVLREPGMITGAMGTAVAHIFFTKLNKPVIKRITGIYAARLDASSTSTMGDAASDTPPQPRELQPGASLGNVGGHEVVIYKTPSVPPSLSDSHQSTLADNHATALSDENSSVANAQNAHDQNVHSCDALHSSAQWSSVDAELADLIA